MTEESAFKHCSIVLVSLTPSQKGWEQTDRLEYWPFCLQRSDSFPLCHQNKLADSRRALKAVCQKDRQALYQRERERKHHTAATWPNNAQHFAPKYQGRSFWLKVHSLSISKYRKGFFKAIFAKLKIQVSKHLNFFYIGFHAMNAQSPKTATGGG